MNNDQEILTAALRWHAANIKRLEVGAEKRREQQYAKERTGYASASTATDQRHSEVKRRERAALRQLAKACKESLQVFTVNVVATDVIDVPMLITCNGTDIDVN